MPKSSKCCHFRPILGPGRTAGPSLATHCQNVASLSLSISITLVDVRLSTGSTGFTSLDR